MFYIREQHHLSALGQRPDAVDIFAFVSVSALTHHPTYRIDNASRIPLALDLRSTQSEPGHGVVVCATFTFLHGLPIHRASCFGFEIFPIRPLCFSVSIPLPVSHFLYGVSGSRHPYADSLPSPSFPVHSGDFCFFCFIPDTARPRAIMRIPRPGFKWHGGGVSGPGRLVEDDDCLSSFRNLSEASISLGGRVVFFFGTRGIKACWEGPDLSFFWKMGELYDKKVWVGG